MPAPATYRERRAQLARDIGSGLLLFPGDDDVGMNSSADVYPFRQAGRSRFNRNACSSFRRLVRMGRCSRKRGARGRNSRQEFLTMCRVSGAG
jgi:hypothetical protein